MGAVYQSVGKDVKTELDRIRQEADAISEQARKALDAKINSVIADIINSNPQVKKTIAGQLQTDVIDVWNATHP